MQGKLCVTVIELSKVQIRKPSLPELYLGH